MKLSELIKQAQEAVRVYGGGIDVNIIIDDGKHRIVKGADKACVETYEQVKDIYTHVFDIEGGI